jgi:hypothetical protein
MMSKTGWAICLFSRTFRSRSIGPRTATGDPRAGLFTNAEQRYVHDPAVTQARTMSTTPTRGAAGHPRPPSNTYICRETRRMEYIGGAGVRGAAAPPGWWRWSFLGLTGHGIYAAMRRELANYGAVEPKFRCRMRVCCVHSGHLHMVHSKKTCLSPRSIEYSC